MRRMILEEMGVLEKTDEIAIKKNQKLSED